MRFPRLFVALLRRGIYATAGRLVVRGVVLWPLWLAVRGWGR